ncbi:MAG: hypothetical protein JWN44_4425 [Myxococcales bacterium]|nr:hypothetical protein [Myxococcales bacterium]
MSVDRSGVAWIEYVSQSLLGFNGAEMFKVSTKDASCTATTYASGQQGMDEFGMGFVSDTAGSNQETLFIAGGSATNTNQEWIGTFSTSTLMVMRGNMINGRPELTGTGKSELWGFFPDINPGDKMARISKLDKVNGTESNTIMLESKLGGSTAEAWAFAFYGGDFWVFLKRANDASTIVYYVKASDGSIQSWAVPGRKIVGAGVSTCAPTVPIG